MPKRRVVDGVEYHCIMRGWGYANWRLALALPLWTIRLAAHMAILKTDLVHALDFDAGLGVAAGLCGRNVPFLYDIQDNFELRHDFPALIRWAIRRLDNWILRRSAATIVVGEERIVGEMNRYRDKIVMIPNCPPEVEAPAGQVRDEENLTLASVGRIAEGRGIRLLLEACERLPWLRAIVVGQVEDEALGEALASCPQIELHGYMPQEKALELVHRSDVSFAFYDPSTEICRRANGAKWYDAMMAGKPLLVNSEVMSSRWIVQEDIGYTIPYNDREKLFDTLQHLHVTRGEVLAKGARARRLYEQKFNRSAMNKVFHELVARVLSTNSSM